MHISDVPANPFWTLLFGSDHTAGLVAVGLLVLAIVAMWRHQRALALWMAAGAAVSGLAAFELSVVTEMVVTLGPVPIAAVLVAMAVGAAVVKIGFSAWHHDLGGLLTFVTLALASTSMLIEMLVTTSANGVLHLVNVIWWGVFIIGAVGLLRLAADWLAAEEPSEVESDDSLTAARPISQGG